MATLKEKAIELLNKLKGEKTVTKIVKPEIKTKVVAEVVKEPKKKEPKRPEPFTGPLAFEHGNKIARKSI